MKEFPGLGEQRQTNLQRPKLQASSGVPAGFILLLVALLVIALFFAVQRVEFIRTERRIQKLLIIKRALTEKILPLQVEAQFLTRYPVIEFYATEHLNLRHPTTRQIILVTPPTPIPAEAQPLGETAQVEGDDVHN